MTRKNFGGVIIQCLPIAFLVPGLTTAAESNSAADEDQITSTGQLEEVVVTAQRRAEPLQTVPIAISAITANDLKDAGIATTSEIAEAVPGLDYTRQSNGATIFLRGVGNPIASPGEESSVALYIDNVYVPTPIASLFSFNNIERVEVEKGPQGTLFGRNATGGVIQIITKDPSETPSLDLSATYANYDTRVVSAYGTTGVTHDLATDLSIYYYDRGDGWGHFIPSGTDVFTAQELAVRNKWLWTPSDDTMVKVSLNVGRTEGQEGVAFHILPGTTGIGGTSDVGFYNASAGFLPSEYAKFGGGAVTLDQNLGFAHFVDILSYQALQAGYAIDEDNTPLPIINATTNERERTFTEEAQLQSADQGPFRWIAGVYLFTDDSRYQPVTVTGLGVAPASEVRTYGDEKTHSYAGFAQTTLELATDTHLTAGIRYTEDRREIDGANDINVGTALLSSPVSQRANFGAPTWRVALDHQFAPDLMAYVSYNRGFKSGLFNTGTPTDPPVRPEILDAYEVGLKSEYLDHKLRVNLSGYYYNYRELQVSLVVVGGQRFVNAASARIVGSDMDVTMKPTAALTLRGGLNVMHAYYTSFPGGPEFVPEPTGGAAAISADLTGNELTHAPRLTADFSANYRYNLGTAGALDIAASYAYSDSFYWDPANDVQQPVTHLVNTSLTWRTASDQLGVSLWGKNVLSEKRYSFVLETALGYAGSPAEPATYGVTVNYRFGK